MDTLMYYNENKYLTQKAAIERFIPVLQNIVDTYGVLNLGDLAQGELQTLVNQPEAFVVNKMTGGTLILNGYEINIDQALKLLKKPDGYDDLITAIASAKISMEGTDSDSIKGRFGGITNCYDFDDNNKIIINAAKDESLQETNKKYAKSPTAKKLFELANMIITECQDPALTNLVRKGAFMSDILRPLISNAGPGILTINIQEISTYN